MKGLGFLAERLRPRGVGGRRPFRVWILGASARALAFSAARAGYTPCTVDLFGDWDLAAVAESHVLPRHVYPEGFAARGPVGEPWCYVGGLENAPDVVDQLAPRAPLWGVEGATLRRVRNPFLLGQVLAAAGYDVPTLRQTAPASNAPNAPQEIWLVKPFRGSGGVGIEPWRGQPLGNAYLQQRVDGVPHAALFWGEQLLGITRQYVGESWCQAPPFHYCGSVGPIVLPSELHARIARLGRVVAAEFGLRGLYGVDVLVDGARLWVLEINPRYPASAEVFELAQGISAFELQRRAFESRENDNWNKDRPSAGEAAPVIVGKAILFAAESCSVRDGAPCYGSCEHENLDGDLAYADIPHPGTRFAAAEPILTVLAQGHGVAEVEARLRSAVQRFARDWLAAETSPASLPTSRHRGIEAEA